MSLLGKRAEILLPEGYVPGWIDGHAHMLDLVNVRTFDGRRFTDVRPNFYIAINADSAWSKYQDARAAYQAACRPQWTGAA